MADDQGAFDYHAHDCNVHKGQPCDCGWNAEQLRQQGHDVADDGSDKPLGYTTPDGHLEVRANDDGTRSYHETELGQHDRWMRQAPDLYALYVETMVPRQPWSMQTMIGGISTRRLSLRDRLRVLFGTPIVAAFRTPDGNCYGACTLHVKVQRDWFDVVALQSGKVG